MKNKVRSWIVVIWILSLVGIVGNLMAVPLTGSCHLE